ncbi:hypothetical protein [Mycolicibacterium agri]|uniref:Uncharacterized protein n=1 Tax=Mycolicibacterium agri TaxID=36811 RepID=A0A7I9W1E8_MYCAG|nr:hypothetical protein [Mycolicibacterium agri]GFG51026.1 hypothetical protein MAGR_24670 [Mycolicibacterium agri]
MTAPNKPRKGGFMVSHLQLVAVTLYLLWCLFASLTGVLDSDDDLNAHQIDESDKNATVR